MSPIRIVPLALACLAGTAEAVTKHYSFSNGYPTTTTRQPTQAAGAGFGAGVAGAAQKTTVRKVEEKSLVGKVVQVDSGDRISVAPAGGRRTKVRLADIDAPEQGQPSGVEAKKFLFDLVNGREVTVRYWTKDRAGAVLGTVFLAHEKGLVEVNLTMVRNGLAWYEESPRPTKTSNAARMKSYSAALTEAKGANRGLWAAANPVRPSEWRKLRH